MNADRNNKNLDELISKTIGRDKPQFDFNKWKQNHEKEIDIFESQIPGRRVWHSAFPVDIWRTIMKSRVSKIAAAAVIIIAVLLGVKFVGVPDMENVAWAEVTNRVAKVDYVHFLFVADPQHHRSLRPYEGWYSRGKMVKCSWQGNMHYDNGQTNQYFDRHKTRIGDKRPSILKDQTFFRWISKGLLAEDNEQFTQQIPTSVGDDFLVYRFDSPEENSDWIDNISITVGRNSLLPIQFKTYHKYDWETGEGIDDIKDGYTLLIFDYEAPEKPSEFFEPPTISKPPHGKGKVVLNGKEATIDISTARDMKTAIMRLYREPSQDNHEPAILVDAAFIVEDGIRSITTERIPLKLNEARKIGMGDVDNWPDKKYRNISATLILRPTEKEDTYIIEISCWLDTIKKKTL